MGLAGAWKVEAFEKDGELVPPVEGSAVTLTFDGDQVYGKAINNFGGAFDPESHFGMIRSTLMAGPPQLMEQEYSFLQLLERVDGHRCDRVIMTAGGRTVMILTRDETEEE